MADVDASLKGEVLHIAQRQRVANVERHHELDHLWRRVEPDGVTGRLDRPPLEAGWSSLRMMVSSATASGLDLRQASSRNDHETVCRNRRVVRMLKRLCGRRRRADSAGGEGVE